MLTRFHVHLASINDPIVIIQRALEEEQEAERATQEIAAGNGTKISKPAAAKEEDGRRKRKGRHQQLLEEWDDLATEERL